MHAWSATINAGDEDPGPAEAPIGAPVVLGPDPLRAESRAVAQQVLAAGAQLHNICDPLRRLSKNAIFCNPYAYIRIQKEFLRR